MSKRLAQRVLLIGWDAADWHFINPMIEAGQMPALKKLMDRGVWGNLATLEPILSPMLWNTIATGQGPDKHGVHGFTEPSPDGQGVRPVRSTSRKCRAIWNMLNLKGMKSNVVGWYASHPAEPINGVMISNQFEAITGQADEDWPVAENSVHPPELIDTIKEARVHPGEFSAAAILPFVSEGHRQKLADPKFADKYNKQLASIASLLAQTSSIHAATTHLIDHTEWDLCATYYEGIDRFGHEFMHFNPPKMDFVDQEAYDLFNEVMVGCYRFHDMMLETLVKMVGDETTIILISDHGYHHAEHRPGDPEKTSPTAWHRPFGIAVAAGPGIKEGERLYAAGLSDITPTILHLLGLPVGSDMAGRVWLDAMTDETLPDQILSWESVTSDEYDDGRHAEDLREDPNESLEALRQLVELGYIDPISDDHEETIRKTSASNQMQLALYLSSVGRYPEAREIYDQLLDDPDQAKTAHWQLLMTDMAEGKLPEADEKLTALEQGSKEQAASDTQTEVDDSEFYDPNRLKMLRASWLIMSKRQGEAQTLLTEVAEAEPENVAVQVRLGQILMDTKQAEAAEQAFRRAIAGDEDNATAWDGLAASLIKQDRHDEAIDAALEAVGLVHGLPRAHLHLGQALYATGDLEHARKALEMCLHLAPRQAEAHATLADLLDQLGENQQANAHRQAASGKMAVSAKPS